MDELHRTIGRIEQFMEHTRDDLLEIKAVAKETSRDIKDLQKYRWKIAGGAAVLSILLTFAVKILDFVTK